MVKAFVIASMIVASVVAGRSVAADPIEYDDDEEYDLGFGIGDGEIYDQIWGFGIDLADQVQKPPVVECTLICSQAENNAMAVCALLPNAVARAACIGAVGTGGAVCRWYCTAR